MPTQVWAVASVLLATLLAAAATLFLKRGAAETRLSVREFRLSRFVVYAVVVYVLSSAFFLLGLLGAQLSVLVPLTALEYIWVLWLARRFLGEPVGAEKLLATACIVLGVVLVGLGS